MKREPIETLSRMAMMQELHEWRTIGPALKAVARAAERAVLALQDAEGRWVKEDIGTPNDTDRALERALARLRRAAPRGTRRGGQ